MAPILVIEDLSVRYGAVEALKGVTLYLDEGEIATVLGANGAGKTTLLNALCGLVPVSEGRILYRGEILNGERAHRIVEKGISQSPEGRKVFSTLTVEENLNLGAFVYRKKRKDVEEGKERVFSLFPLLRERRKQLSGTLSGGEQQMLAIGRALMSHPRVLLLDEPSLGLAPILVGQIFQIIDEINRQGTTILLVEQNAHKALGIAHKGYVLESGNMAMSGSAAELRSNPRIQEAYLGGAALRKKSG
ncbi:MAG TPA: ABC transporter ATP-binding protein [Syntrophales bacterium]|nr:ABC transporter ATP-binding protein [Syntrophales bacterium]